MQILSDANTRDMELNGIRGNQTMHTRQTKRREFLRQIGIFLGGLFILPVQQLFESAGKTREKTTPPREAKYYTSSDHLAG